MNNELDKEEILYKRYSNIVIVFILLPLAFYFIFTNVTKDSEINELKQNAWKQMIVNNGIQSLYFVTDTIYYETSFHGDVWAELKKLYVNGHIADPDTLYLKDDFLYYLCGKYFFYGRRSTDSISYKFPPKDLYNGYLGKEISYFRSNLGSNYDLMQTYKNKLPKCLNITK